MANQSPSQSPLLLDPLDTLVFKVAKYPLPSVDSENGHTECLLTLTNTSLKRIGFKMKSTAVQHYGADPATGIIEPGRRLIVSVRLWHQAGVDLTTLPWERHKVGVTYHAISIDCNESDVDTWLKMHKETADTKFLKCVIRHSDNEDEPSLQSYRDYRDYRDYSTRRFENPSTLISDNPMKVIHESIVSELERQKKKLAQENAQFRSENAQLKSENAQLNSENVQLRSENAQLKDEANSLRVLLESTERDYSNELKQVKTQLYKLQEESRQSRWEVSSSEIHVKKEIGRGAYATVYEGFFREQRVAVKVLHDMIKSHHNLEIFKREVSLLARVRHPNLLLFIAVAFDHENERPPLMVTELMTMSLRNGYTNRIVEKSDMKQIMYDVACALHYLHSQEEPILHRDVSSANVLLQKQDNVWRGKLSDFGAANFARFSVSSAPGAEVYTAPEVPRECVALSLDETQKQRQEQTTKVDVFSYGVLLCEVFTEKPQLPSQREFLTMLRYVENRFSWMHKIIKSCIERDPSLRPTMEKILQDLKKIFPSCFSNE